LLQCERATIFATDGEGRNESPWSSKRPHEQVLMLFQQWWTDPSPRMHRTADGVAL
jgi:hypothetical protein